MRTLKHAVAAVALAVASAVAPAAAVPATAARHSMPDIDDASTKYWSGVLCDDDIVADFEGSQNRVASVSYSRLYSTEQFRAGKASVIRVYQETAYFDENGALRYKAATYKRPGPPASKLMTCTNYGFYGERLTVQIKVLGRSPWR